MDYWFNAPAIKPLLPLAGASFIKGLASTFNGSALYIGANVFPEGPQIIPGPITWIGGKCPRKKAIIVTDEIAEQFCGKVERALKEGGFETRIWNRSLPEPPVERVKELAGVMNEFEPDLIVPVGGGSVIDGAKAAWVLYERPDIADLYQVMPLFPLGIRKKAIMMAVPTTSGTGSETTMTSVVHDEENDRKVPLSNPELVPDYAILNPEFTVTMPPKLTMGVGLDVLAHACDCLFGMAHNDFSDALGMKATQMVFEWLPKAYKNGKNLEARHRMLIASAMAGMAFNNSTPSLTHALGHSLGGIFKVHHGIAVGLFMPYSMQFYHPATDKIIEVAKGLDVEGKDKDKCLANVIKKLKGMYKEIEAPLSIKELGISKKDLEANMDKLVLYALEDISTTFTPRPLKEEQCKKIFRYAWQGKDIDF